MSNPSFRFMSFYFRIRDLFSSPITILKQIGIRPGSYVLDYGCGATWYSNNQDYLHFHSLFSINNCWIWLIYIFKHSNKLVGEAQLGITYRRRGDNFGTVESEIQKLFTWRTSIILERHSTPFFFAFVDYSARDTLVSTWIIQFCVKFQFD